MCYRSGLSKVSLCPRRSAIPVCRGMTKPHRLLLSRDLRSQCRDLLSLAHTPLVPSVQAAPSRAYDFSTILSSALIPSSSPLCRKANESPCWVCLELRLTPQLKRSPAPMNINSASRSNVSGCAASIYYYGNAPLLMAIRVPHADIIAPTNFNAADAPRNALDEHLAFLVPEPIWR